MKLEELGSPEKVTSSGLPDRLQSDRGEETRETAGTRLPRCPSHAQELALDALAGCEAWNRLTIKGFHTKRG